MVRLVVLDREGTSMVLRMADGTNVFANRHAGISSDIFRGGNKRFNHAMLIVRRFLLFLFSFFTSVWLDDDDDDDGARDSPFFLLLFQFISQQSIKGFQNSTFRGVFQ